MPQETVLCDGIVRENLLLDDPDDEPTSFLDPETECRLIAGLRSFLGERTTLVLITHRPS